MVFHQSESQGQPRFKGKGSFVASPYLLLREAIKNMWLSLICHKVNNGDLENVSIGFHPPLVDIPSRVFFFFYYLITSCA